MPDPYAHIASADVDLQARLAAVLELRAADPQQRAMLDAYLSEVRLPDSAIALDVGCGTGAVTRALAEMPNVREAIGIDPSSVFVEKAREIGKANPRLSFRTGDARALLAQSTQAGRVRRVAAHLQQVFPVGRRENPATDAAVRAERFDFPLHQ